MKAAFNKQNKHGDQYTCPVSVAILWFTDEKCVVSCETIIYWEQFCDNTKMSASFVSLPDLVSGERDFWRARYIAWVNEIGKVFPDQSVNGVSDDPRYAFNYWWMTLPTQSSFESNSLAYTIMRLWALEKTVNEMQIKELIVYRATTEISALLHEWGSARGFRVQFLQTSNRQGNELGIRQLLRSSSSSILRVTQGIIVLIANLFQNGNWLRARATQTGSSNADFVIFDYFANIEIDEKLKTNFKSRYWGELPELLADMNFSVNWVHIYIPTVSAPHIADAVNQIEKLNQNLVNQSHTLLQSATNLPVAIRSFIIFRRINKVSKGLKKAIARSLQDSGEPFLSHYIWRNFQSSIFGSSAGENATLISLLNEYIRNCSRESTCLYLMENQPWEMALLSIWKRYQRGGVLGVPHSTTRFWDLRYALTLMASRSALAWVPQPDAILVNGAQSARQLINNGVEPSRIHQVESLRYSGVANVRRPKEKKNGNQSSRPQLLVFGEYAEVMSRKQVAILNSFMETESHEWDVVYRPHPAILSTIPELNSCIMIDYVSSISGQLSKSHVSFCGSVSSAVFDSLIGQTPVLILRDAAFLDGNFLDNPMVQGVDNILGLKKALAAIRRNKAPSQSADIHVLELFNLDTNLHRWKNLLSALKMERK